MLRTMSRFTPQALTSDDRVGQVFFFNPSKKKKRRQAPVVVEVATADDYDSIYKVLRIEEVLNEGSRSAILVPLRAGESQELSLKTDDLNKLKKVPPLKGLEIDILKRSIVNISGKPHIKYWTDIIQRNANVSVQSAIDQSLCTYPSHCTSIEELQEVIIELGIDIQLRSGDFKKQFP